MGKETEESCTVNLIELAQRVATLEERGKSSQRGRKYLNDEVNEVNEKVEAHGRVVTSMLESSRRIGDHTLHEDHHRHVAAMLKRKEERRATFVKIRDDLLSKSTLWLLTLAGMGVAYIYHTLPNLLTQGTP